MTDEPPWPPQVVRPFARGELVVTAQMRAQAFWCLRRFTSLTYARRCGELLEKFLGGFLGWAGEAPPSRTGFIRATVKSLATYQEAFEETLPEFLADHPSAAYGALQVALGLIELEGPAFDDGMAWVEFGSHRRERPATGLFTWAERSVDMAVRIRMTLAAEWTYTRLLLTPPPYGFRRETFPRRLEPLPAPTGPTLATDEVVPTTGIWVPSDESRGCPAFLVAGWPAPTLTIEITQIDTPAWPGSASEPARPATSEYVYDNEPTKWRLAWTDTRYRAGVEPDESEFLDEEADLPRHPPVHPQPS